jgi:hypothetical protein
VVKQGAYVRDGRLLFRDKGGQREVVLVSEIPLKGAHNVENTLAAVCVGALMGCETGRIRGAVLEHSVNGGSTWEGVTTNATTELTAGSAPSSTVCWVVGRAGTVLLSSDGRTWRRVAFPEPVDLAAVQATDARTATVTTIAIGPDVRDRRRRGAWVRR